MTRSALVSGPVVCLWGRRPPEADIGQLTPARARRGLIAAPEAPPSRKHACDRGEVFSISLPAGTFG